ncbi:kinesin-like protein Klp10A isoform X2 [Fopius arisanus]|uniref:Kinesin-like protein Klp10A isoform X2 n=1 Tax=Fopius arisanus TaxID=64838 RepID=A0A9R1TRZ8_9HYME|nr:PREDICTED: kinesin-like protein Klp10A isoform X2 [Fopius arisanus]
MGWFSKCVCGVKNAKSHPKRERNKKQNSKTSPGRGDIYVIQEQRNEETGGKRRNDNRDTEVNHVEKHQEIGLERQELVRVNEADRGTKDWSNGELPQTIDPNHQNYLRSPGHEEEFYDSLSESRSDETLQANSLKNKIDGEYRWQNGSPTFNHSNKLNPSSMVHGKCRASSDLWESSDKNRIASRVNDDNDTFEMLNNNLYNNNMSKDFDVKEGYHFALMDGGRLSVETIPQRSKFFREASIKKSGNEQDFRSGMNSCSFVIPFQENEAMVKGNRKKKIHSMIPKPSSRGETHHSSNDGMHETSNGRVHSAIVSGVNWESKSVTVEWFEKGETKGKEVEMDTILTLNPELTSKSMGPPQNNNMISTTRSRHSTRPSIPVKAGSNRQIARQTGRPTNIMPPVSSINGHDSVSGLTSRRELENIPPTPTAPTFSNVTSSAISKTKQIQPPQTQQQPKQQQQQQQQQQEQLPSNQSQVENGRGRRSNVVKEVERLKKNREERRQRQAELKEEKEALMNLDPGNPNWEFLAMIREYQNSIDFRPLRESDAVEDHQITVCVRKRPLNRKEVNRKEVDVISVPSKDQMVVHEPKSKVDLTKYLDNQLFRFDYAFDETCTNEIVYKYTAKPLVQTIFEGGMATCFAYGQTGSGKTHTMGGDFNGKTQDCKKGIYAMVAKDVFKYLKLPKYRGLNLVISASFFEIYSGKVFDLLADKEKLRVLEDGKQQVQIVGLTEKVVETCDEVLKLIQNGNSARTSGQTSANSNSSRSHAVFQIVVRSPGTHKIHGKFSLIDLAGNERGADTSSANRQTRMEGAEINKSLLALKECIRALGRKGTHLPFRASKLTQVLRDSFIGEKSRTCMIAMISPGMSSCEHSLNTLRYADRVKELAATDPTEMKASPTDDDQLFKIDEQGNDSVLSDSDLAQLRSLNEGELSQDLYTFHEAVSALQLMEEEVLDTHKLVMENTPRFLNAARGVFTTTHEVDYDQEDASSNPSEKTFLELIGNFGGGGESLDASINDWDEDMSRKCVITPLSITRSPWKFECQESSSSSELSQEMTKTSKLMKKKETYASAPMRKTTERALARDSASKRSSTPRRRWSLTTKKTTSKYSWTGQFRAKRSIFTRNPSTVEEKKEFLSLTRTPSPVDSGFLYGRDPETEAKVFQLNTTRTIRRNTSESMDSLNDDLKIDDDWWKSEDEGRHFCEAESDPKIADDFVNLSDFGKVNVLRQRFGRMKRPSWINADNSDVLTMNDLYVNDNDDYNGAFDLSNVPRYGDSDEEKGSFYCRAKDFFLAFLVNVLMFAFLPVIYITIFIYMHGDDD